jgi:hypothetical protein
VIGEQGQLHFLSPGDAALVIETIPVPKRPDFFYAAAEVLEAYRDSLPAPRRVEPELGMGGRRPGIHSG